MTCRPGQTVNGRMGWRGQGGPQRRWLLAVALVGYGALALHGRRFDFLCDDAFIALRYAQHFVEWGAPVYNRGEQVEGFTSVAWVTLVAALYRVGVTPVRGVQLLGHVAAATLMGVTVWLGASLCPRRPVTRSLVTVIALAASAPVAAWSFGGLETPLFSASIVALVALATRAASGSPKRAALAGIAGAGATLVRPEGALFALLVGLVLTLAWRRAGKSFRFVGSYVVGYLLFALPPLVGRWVYYGDPLPNTFYVKATGAAAELTTQGLRYLRFAATEMGGWFVGAVALALLWPSPVEPPQPTELDQNRFQERAVFMGSVRLLTLAQLLYVARIGGDFLDLYRFLAPFFPLWILTVTLLVLRSFDAPLLSRKEGWWCSWAMAFAYMVILGGYSWQQWQLGTRALQETEPERALRRIEPLGWTRTYALRWAAVGRWMAANAAPGNTTAIGAAGAMPYYAGLPNLDLFGLCDAWVARHGRMLGLRPGHQRFATDAYLLAKRPAFLLLHAEDVTEAEPVGSQDSVPPRDPFWNARGYTWADVSVEAARYGGSGERDLRVRLLIRQDRGFELTGVSAVRMAPP